ncbi:hypothetical protein ACH41E_13585 [Streptomyces sp. NPDC020412]|uniref:hypothetical protein n=1 Tax=Streptomyces sp. NPDC020412 TaxID=3365073 RepID=UPI0037B14749
MQQRVRMSGFAGLPALFLGLCAALLVLLGAAPSARAAVAAGSTVTTPVGANPTTPDRAGNAQRTTVLRPESRRATSAAVDRVVAADTGSRPPTAPPASAHPLSALPQPPLLRGEPVGPRQERGPPQRHQDSPSTRAPPAVLS